MRHLTAALLLIVAAGCCAARAADRPADGAAAPVKVFLLAGQSNMQGQGVVSMDHEQHYNGGKGNLVWSMAHSASRDRMAHLRDADGAWVERDDVTIWYKQKDKVRHGKLTVGYTGYGGSSHIGPELQFGHVVGDAFDAPVLLIKTAWGGKSLHADFRPPGAGGTVGPYYTQMIAEVREALAALGDTPYELAGFVWMQGWNDMINKEATAEYAENLVHFAADVRRELNAPDLPFVIGELGNMGPAKPGSGMETFRAAQKLGASRIANAVFVETHTFARDKDLSPNTGHGHHWFGNAESYFLIGDALGKAMVRLTTNAAPAAAAPDFPPGQWVPIFNGKNLDGWSPKIRYHDLGENYGQTFYVEDGLMKVKYDPKFYPEFGERFGHIFYTVRPFSRYRLRIEYRFVGDQCPGGPGWATRNSGVMLHGQHPSTMTRDQDFPVSIEAQFLGGLPDGKPRSTSNLCTPGTHVVYNGGLFTRHCTSSSSKTYAGDQWVTVEFDIRGSDSITHLIDGQPVLRYENPQYDPNDPSAKPLIKDPAKLLIEGGYISLQSESHPVHFRKVEVMVVEE